MSVNDTQEKPNTSVDKLYDLLTRPTFDEMRQLYVDFLNYNSALGGIRGSVWSLEKEELFFSSRKWTYDEFIKVHQDLDIEVRYF